MTESISGVSGDQGSSQWVQSSVQKILAGADTNADGSISKEELGGFAEEFSKILNKRMAPPHGRPVPGPDLERLFSEIDSNGDGKISEEELTAYVTRQKERMDEMRTKFEPDTEKLFAEIDSDGDGSISKDELTAFITSRLQNMEAMAPKRPAETEEGGMLPPELLSIMFGDQDESKA